MQAGRAGVIVTFKVQPEKADEFGVLLAHAVELANADDLTCTWCSLRYSETEFGIFEVFADEASREAHFGSAPAAEFGQRVAAFLADTPAATFVEVLSAK